MAGLAALPLFLSLRAAIRAKVEAAGAERLEGAKRDEARALARAISLARSSFFAMARPGSSRSAGSPASAKARSPARSRRGSARRPARYGCAATSSARRCSPSRRRSICRPRRTREDVTRDVYRRLIEKARAALRAGQAVVLDATFATAAERNAAADAAFEAGAAFAGLFLDAPLATRLARIASRRARRFRRRR